LQIDSWFAELAHQASADLGVEVAIAPPVHATLGADDVEVDHGQNNAGDVMMF